VYEGESFLGLLSVEELGGAIRPAGRPGRPAAGASGAS
jgi:hypothetical protein